MAIATHSLCDAANAMVQGEAGEEKLISSSKQVAASTAQLLLACRVKANPNSKAMQRLQVMKMSAVTQDPYVNGCLKDSGLTLLAIE